MIKEDKACHSDLVCEATRNVVGPTRLDRTRHLKQVAWEKKRAKKAKKRYEKKRCKQRVEVPAPCPKSTRRIFSFASKPLTVRRGVMFKRMYYIVTSDTENIGLRLYELGRFTRKGLKKQLSDLNKEFPVLFLVLKGWQLKMVAQNIIKKKELTAGMKAIANQPALVTDLSGHQASQVGGKKNLLN